MLSKSENKELTEVGPGTPAGLWLRRYWHPVAISDKWEGVKTHWDFSESLTCLLYTSDAADE